jgi:excisionase family DNA binding protein
VDNQALTVSRVAKRLDTSNRTVLRIIESGQLIAHRIGRRQWRIFEPDLQEYLARQSNRKAAA